MNQGSSKGVNDWGTRRHYPRFVATESRHMSLSPYTSPYSCLEIVSTRSFLNTLISSLLCTWIGHWIAIHVPLSLHSSLFKFRNCISTKPFLTFLQHAHKQFINMGIEFRPFIPILWLLNIYVSPSPNTSPYSCLGIISTRPFHIFLLHAAVCCMAMNSDTSSYVAPESKYLSLLFRYYINLWRAMIGLDAAT